MKGPTHLLISGPESTKRPNWIVRALIIPAGPKMMSWFWEGTLVCVSGVASINPSIIEFANPRLLTKVHWEDTHEGNRCKGSIGLYNADFLGVRSAHS